MSSRNSKEASIATGEKAKEGLEKTVGSRQALGHLHQPHTTIAPAV